MSGSGGGGGLPSINRPSATESCDDLVINTNLASPRTEVVTHLEPGNILDIRLEGDQGPIVAVDGNGNVAGSIISREQLRLLSCIVAGTQFVAEILSIINGQCQVQIRTR